MKVTRDVIGDLLPAYLADEASEDTRALVEAYCESHPETARLLEAGGKNAFEINDMPKLAEEVEMDSLRRTKKMLRTRSTFLGFAIFSTLAPFSLLYTETTGFRWVVLENPVAAAVYLGLAVVCWGAFLAMKHRMRSVGV